MLNHATFELHVAQINTKITDMFKELRCTYWQVQLTDTTELHYEFCWKNKLKYVKNKMRVTMFSKTFGKLMWMALPNGLCKYYMQHPLPQTAAP